jgi:hypothetical protein
MRALPSSQLTLIHGGYNMKFCGPNDPIGYDRNATTVAPLSPHIKPGAPPTMSEQIIQNTDRALQPWKVFNGIFGGLGPNTPRTETVQPKL